MTPHRSQPRPARRGSLFTVSQRKTGVGHNRPLSACLLLVLTLLNVITIAALAAAVVIAYYKLTAKAPAPQGDVPRAEATSLPVDQLAAPDTGADLPVEITYAPGKHLAFPVAADPSLYIWTHYHWDGINAVDIEARFGLTHAEFTRATHAVIAAVTNGTLLTYNGPVGGQGYLLQGDDGLDYYYAHLSEQWVADGARVLVGQPLGRMGRTGNSAQFIEPHLHFAIGARDTLYTQMPGINAAEWLDSRFGLPWQNRLDGSQVVYSVPKGWPVHHPDIRLLTPFDQALAKGLPQPAVELGFDHAPAGPVDVVATLDGEINVIRWTDHYGTRLQVTNRAAQTTAVISGVDQWLVKDGDLVRRGDVIGRWRPGAAHPRLHYMIFQNNGIIDPTPSMGQIPPTAQAVP